MGRHTTRRPVGGIKNVNGTAVVIALLGVLGAAVAVVGLLVVAITGAAALPWLIVLGVSVATFFLGAINI